LLTDRTRVPASPQLSPNMRRMALTAADAPDGRALIGSGGNVDVLDRA
jgi:hypothetical protein